MFSFLFTACFFFFTLVFIFGFPIFVFCDLVLCQKFLLGIFKVVVGLIGFDSLLFCLFVCFVVCFVFVCFCPCFVCFLFVFFLSFLLLG